MKFVYKSSRYLLAFIFVVTAVPSFAQTTSEIENQTYDLTDQLKKDYFSLGLLVQGRADFYPRRTTGHNGFSASYGRFKVSGIFGDRFGYNLQATMLKTPSVIDANIYIKPTSHFSIKTGLFKSPFTHEYLTGASSVLFVNRSTVVNNLGTKRQVGAQIDAYTPNRTLRFTGGIFNGNNHGNNLNDDNHFQYIARVETHLDHNNEKSLKIGANIAYEQKDTPGSGNLQTSFSGEQTLLGSYASFSQDKLLIDGEFIYGWMNPEVAPQYNPYGYYITTGYYVTSSSRILLRWDSFHGDNLSDNSESLIFGFNYSPSAFSKIKANYILPTDQAVNYSNLLIALQVGF